MLSRLATLIDTYDWRKRYKAYKEGVAATSRPDIGFYKTKKAQYRYRCSGTGPTIVFLCDPPNVIESYDALFAALSPHYRVIVLEAAGMGFSAANNRYGFAFEETSDDLIHFLKSVAGEGAILAFSCVSGLAAIDIAVRYPELVSRLFLIQTTDWDGFHIWMNGCDPKGLLRKPFLGQLGIKKVGEKQGLKWIETVTGNPDTVQPLCCCARQGFENDMLFSLASSFQRYIRGESPLRRPTQPMTILWGEADKSHSPESIERSRTLGEDVQIILRPTLGHFPELEDPQGLSDILQALEPVSETPETSTG
ncbi:MAG: alpha/beta hydrolase [Pseudomonadota bacterium]